MRPGGWTRPALAAVLTACLGLCGCGSLLAGSGSEAGNADATIAASCFIKLPSALAASPPPLMGKCLAAASSPASDLEIYNGVREIIGLADALVHDTAFGVIAFITTWHNTLPWQTIRRTGFASGSEDGFTFTASYSSTGREYPYQLMVCKDGTAGEPAALRIDYNGDRVRPRGRAFVYLDLLDPQSVLGTRLAVTFAIDDSGRTLDLEIASDSVATVGDDQIKNLRVQLVERNGLIHVSGCAYLPALDSLLPDTVGYCYIFTGVADSSLNRATVNLGLPPATYQGNDSALFTTYGIARMWGQSLLRYQIPALDSTTKSFIVTSCADSVTIEEIMDSIALLGSYSSLRDAAGIDSMTLDQLVYVLTLNQGIGDSAQQAEFAELLWFLRLRQPVYFDAGGYAGNGGDVPAGFEYLAIPVCLPPQIPDVVRLLSVSP